MEQMGTGSVRPFVTRGVVVLLAQPVTVDATDVAKVYD